jgi:hypothetical protein
MKVQETKIKSLIQQGNKFMNKEQYFDASIVYEKAISICAQNDCDEWIQKISENFAS